MPRRSIELHLGNPLPLIMTLAIFCLHRTKWNDRHNITIGVLWLSKAVICLLSRANRKLDASLSFKTSLLLIWKLEHQSSSCMQVTLACQGHVEAAESPIYELSEALPTQPACSTSLFQKKSPFISKKSRKILFLFEVSPIRRLLFRATGSLGSREP